MYISDMTVVAFAIFSSGSLKIFCIISSVFALPSSFLEVGWLVSSVFICSFWCTFHYTPVMAPNLVVIVFIIESCFYKRLRHLYVFKKIVIRWKSLSNFIFFEFLTINIVVPIFCEIFIKCFEIINKVTSIDFKNGFRIFILCPYLTCSLLSKKWVGS